MSDTETLNEFQHLDKLFYSDLRICGCGNPEEVYALVRDLLSLAPFYDHPGKIRERIGGNTGDDGPYYMVLYALDGAGLIEHGGSVGGSWLTAKGAHYLELMKRHEWDEIDGCDDLGVSGPVGYPHDGADCPAACVYRHDPVKVTVSREDLEAVYEYARHFDVDTDPAMQRVRAMLGLPT